MSTKYSAVSWLRGANLYEVNIRQYTKEGSFAAFQQHLPRLKEMGVEILWLMPITPISHEQRQGTLGSYYACSSYTTINPEFGTLRDFKNLVKAVHALDMKIIIDWVANHTGWDHHWTREHPDWYKKDAHGNFTEAHGWKDVIDLDHSNGAMGKALIKAMKFWINEADIDGFRCDMAHLVPLSFWQEARTACDEIKSLFWLAETDEKKYHEVFDVSYAWSWMQATQQYVKQQQGLNAVWHELEKYAAYPKGAQKLWFTSNHDENSWNGTEYEKYNGAAAAFAVFTCTWPGIPLIYSGQELPNYKRLKFFDKDEIEWSLHAPKLHDFYRKLLKLKKGNAALWPDAALLPLPTEAKNEVMAFQRAAKNGKILVILNLSRHSKIKVTLNPPELAGKYRHLFTEIEYNFEETETFELPAWGYLIYESIE